MRNDELENPLEVVDEMNKEAERKGTPWRLIAEPNGVRKVSVEEYELWRTRNSN
jgi:hypothetical protein